MIQRNSHLSAGKTATIISGNDTTLTRAIAGIRSMATSPALPSKTAPRRR
ncbi:hypothetical protein [Xanthomonas arboricola]